MSWTHLCFGVRAHCYVEEFFVEEWYTTFHTPCRQTLVGAQAIVHVEFGEFSHGFVVEILGTWCLVEVEVTTEDFVSTLTRKHHLDTHRLDDAGKEVHRCGGTNSGHIVGLDEIDDIVEGIESLLDGVVDFVVNRADIVGNETCLLQIWRTFQSYGKGMESWPIGTCLSIVFNAVFGIAFGNGGNDTGIESTAEQYTVWHIGHQLALHGLAERLADFFFV